MADDKHHTMTKGVDNLNLEDDKKNEIENDEEEGLNDDPEQDDISPEEFEALNSQMDQLNSALDVLEEQNDIIHAKLIDLLESNRAARKQFKEEQEKKANETAEKSKMTYCVTVMKSFSHVLYSLLFKERYGKL